MESMDEYLARRTVKKYVCSNCWGDLELKPDMVQGRYFAICTKCGDETKGYVTKFFVARRRNENEFEKQDAVRVLRKIGVLENPHAGKTVAQLLKELGY